MEKVNYQPAEMRTVMPYLMVNKVSDLILFLETVFGGKLKYKLDRPDGSVMHAEIVIGDSVIMSGEPMEEYGVFPAAIYIYVPDCDSIYQKAIDFGAVSVMTPTTMTHAGERYGCVKDANGNMWWIATHIEDVSPQEMANRIEDMKDKWTTK